MADVVVVGGGLGGLAAAARLAKLGHAVRLVERSPRVGGALLDVEDDALPGFAWDAAVSTVLLPAVLRDLFRKSGRPLERELELVPQDVLREHRFADGGSLTLHAGSRGRQAEAFDALRAGLGERWLAYVDEAGRDWEALRTAYFEVPPDLRGRDALPAEARLRLDSRETLERRARAAFRDRRARLVATHPAVLDGQDPRLTPGWTALTAYLEQTFGTWRVVGGTGALAAALEQRLVTRGVEVLAGVRALDVRLEAGRAVGVRVQRDGATPEDLDADLVVCAIDPRGLPALAPHVATSMPALPPVVSHLALRDDDPSDPLPDLPPELVLHGEPLLVVRPGGRAPEGHRAWSILARGRVDEDLAVALARRGLDVRSRIVGRVDLSARALVERWHGSPYGVLWQGRGTVRRRLGPTTPVPGVLAAGAHATPGAGLPAVGLSAALVAQVVGPA
ncbi:FAD-dependent oxidoreductase [Nocardioides sp. TRM66260-LWL]|uniref:phytoene desaturase family protein n=1 Tax=Nocardioides sp. TRM66260-LWL TaxID=2874478 RepID=UPI001CC702F4|nr:FAD-dependent oxidoreductase [Nocardioides sp. TRM66260-LWL]MBZ5733332.1 FAD-dependent oxidoreductase [Nocardioides sp. TRM66260-LWL]